MAATTGSSGGIAMWSRGVESWCGGRDHAPQHRGGRLRRDTIGYRRFVIDPRPPDVHFEFENDPSAPRRARRALAPLFTDPRDAIADAVNLAASELVSNVVLHTAFGGQMNAWDPKPDVPLRLEVHDHAPVIPVAPHHPDVTGRGLGIVDDVSDAWGVEPTADGKIVWAEFNRPAGE
jgi:hypothetical protein